jgi:hypothetical protein
MSRPYKLRFPFRPTSTISGLDEPQILATEPIVACLSKSEPYFILTVDGFGSEEQARAFLATAWGSVMWASVKAGVGLQAETGLGQVVYPDDPTQAGMNLAQSFGLASGKPVHGLADGNVPVVLPSEKTIRFLTGSGVWVGTTPIHNLIPHLEKALRSPRTAALFDNERFRIALELWSNGHCEFSSTSKFLTLVMALEVLTEPKPKHSVAQELLDRWAEMLDERMAAFKKDGEEYHALESLRRELLFRRDQSIRSRVREMVMAELASVPEERRHHLARLAVKAYDLRGSLVHEGRLSLADLSEGHEAAREVIQALFTNGLAYRA